jgi:hypothetical protein
MFWVRNDEESEICDFSCCFLLLHFFLSNQTELFGYLLLLLFAWFGRNF